jgi:hypothetical protein
MHIKADMAEARLVKQILVDGEDVTSRCVEVESEEGWAKLQVMNPLKGRPMVVLGSVVTQVKHGKVEVVMEDADPS